MTIVQYARTYKGRGATARTCAHWPTQDNSATLDCFNIATLTHAPAMSKSRSPQQEMQNSVWNNAGATRVKV